MLQLLFELLARCGAFFALTVSRGSFPRAFTPTEERECLSEIAKGNSEAREQLILHNLRLIAHIAKKYYAPDGDPDELVSIGTIGLIKAADSFDSSRGTRFSTYAARCIENEILMELRASRRLQRNVRIWEPIGADEGNDSLTLADLLPSEDNLEEDAESRAVQEAVSQSVRSVLQGRDLRVLSMRYGLFGYEAHTQAQVAEKLGISRSYVSRIEKRAVETVRRDLKRKNI